MGNDENNDTKYMIPNVNHILYKSARDIRDIASPLEKHLNIKEFTYERIYNNNQKIKLTNQPEWIAYFYQNNFHLLGGDDTVDNLQAGVNLTSNMISMNNDQTIFESCRKFYDIGDGIVLVDRFEEYRELYWFTSDTSNKYLLDYHRNIELLRIFTHSFKEKAKKLIKNSEYQKIIRPPTLYDLSMSAYENHELNEIEFLKSTSIKKYTFYYKKREIVLTRKELQCALGLICGKSAKEISNDLYRSVRTIEAHIDNLRMKLNCSSRSNLVNMLLGMGISIYINRVF